MISGGTGDAGSCSGPARERRPMMGVRDGWGGRPQECVRSLAGGLVGVVEMWRNSCIMLWTCRGMRLYWPCGQN